MPAQKSRKTLLARPDYRALLQDVKKFVRLGNAKAASGKIESQWQIGKRIAMLKLTSEAGYHNSVIRDLSADSGLAMSTLHHSVQFFETYDKTPSDEGLSWGHYRVLITLPTKADRDFYIKKIQAGAWTTRQLEAAVSRRLHEAGPAKRLTLKRPSPSDYVYLARVVDVVDGDTVDLSLDLGFGVKRELRARLAEVDAPNIDTKKGRAARDFLAVQFMQAKTVAVQTHKSDRYGRFVAHIFCASRALSAVECFQSGQHVNELLVRERLAVVVA